MSYLHYGYSMFEVLYHEKYTWFLNYFMVSVDHLFVSLFGKKSGKSVEF